MVQKSGTIKSEHPRALLFKGHLCIVKLGVDARSGAHESVIYRFIVAPRLVDPEEFLSQATPCHHPSIYCPWKRCLTAQLFRIPVSQEGHAVQHHSCTGRRTGAALLSLVAVAGDGRPVSLLVRSGGSWTPCGSTSGSFNCVNPHRLLRTTGAASRTPVRASRMKVVSPGAASSKEQNGIGGSQ